MNRAERFACGPGREVPIRDLSLVFVVCWAVTAGLQWLNGAFEAEFGREPDEAAHYVTGLCVRDYVAGGFPGAPLRFAHDYYEHYPKVALGHWPPFFYVLQTAWTLPFGVSCGSVLMLMAALTAATATLLFGFLARELNCAAAGAGALLFLSLPLVQQFSAAVMTEIPMALLLWLAMDRWGRFLDSERRGDAVAFGVLAGLAILTKFSGAALAVAAPLALVWTGKWRLLRSGNLWLGVAVAAMLAGPWTLATLSVAQEGMLGERWGWDFSHRAVPYYAAKLHLALGTAVLGFALVGLAAKVIAPRCRGRAGSESVGIAGWACAAALMLGVIGMQMIVPTGREARHLVPALAPAVALALAGVSVLTHGLQRRGWPARTAGGVGIGVLLVAFAVETFRLQPKGYGGFGAVAEALLGATSGRPARVLICSDARGEGMFIAEMAMRERRPGSVIRRGSKALARSGWAGADYRDTVRDTAGVLDFLKTDQIEFVVVDGAVPSRYRRPYHALVEETVRQDRAHLLALREFAVLREGIRHGGALRLYRVVWL